MRFINWLLNTNGQKPKYQDVPYITKNGMITPPDFKEDDENQRAQEDADFAEVMNAVINDLPHPDLLPPVGA